MLASTIWDQAFAMPQIAIIMGCLVGCLIPIAGIISSYWYKAQKVRSENDLKRSMVERGMTVEEIERVMSTRSHGG